MIGSYQRFHARVLAELEAFRVDAREGHLAEVAEMLPSSQTFPAEIRAPIRYLVEGWLDPGLSPDQEAMRRANPDFRFRIRRYRRPDVGEGRRAGFRIDATARFAESAPELQPAFRPIFVDGKGRERILPTSNETAAHVLSRCQPDRRRPNLKRDKGYIDEVRVSLRPGDRARNLWMARLVTEEPAALLPFADSVYGEPWRAAFVRALAAALPLDRWADRFRLISSGLVADFTSDLEPLAVERPRPDLPSPSPALPRPQPRRHEGLVDFAPGPAPMAAPDTRWLSVDEARVQDGGTVTTPDTLVSYETAADPSLTFVAGVWESSFGSVAHPEGMLLHRKPSAEATIPEGILLAGRNDDNWYHWLAEYLPRVLSIPPDIPPDVPLLVSRRTPATGVEALVELSERPMVLLDPAVSQPVARLHVAPPVVQVLDTGYGDWGAATTVARAPLDALRARLGVDTPRDGDGRRIFLTRRSAHRGIRNEPHLASIAGEAGLELVDPAGLTFAEQRELFASAELVVGASGAVMANYLLMRPGSAIIALTSEQLHDFVLPAAMAAVAGCSFRYVLGTSELRLEDVKDLNHWIHADFTIDETAFADALNSTQGRSARVAT